MTSGLTVALALAWLAGLGLGALFFGGLWWTVQRAIWAPQPALFFVGSSLLRTAAVLVGLYWVSAGHWERMVACLVGLVMARIAVIRVTRPSGARGIGRMPEANRAP